MKKWQHIKQESYNQYSDDKQIEKWIRDDMKEAKFELQGYQRMRDSEMINYWKEVVEYFQNFLTNNINVERLKQDLRLGNDAEQYAAGKILVRMGC